MGGEMGRFQRKRVLAVLVLKLYSRNVSVRINVDALPLPGCTTRGFCSRHFVTNGSKFAPCRERGCTAPGLQRRAWMQGAGAPASSRALLPSRSSSRGTFDPSVAPGEHRSARDFSQCCVGGVCALLIADAVASARDRTVSKCVALA
jgi:hypothetical protein